MKAVLLVALGSAIGGASRYGVGLWLTPLAGQRWPYATLAVNVLGALLIGLVAGNAVSEGRWVINENFRLFLMAGVLGGFTTFSAYSLQTLELLQAGYPERALLYALGSVLLCLAGVAAGYWIAT
ncbi:MAG: fluoride efflux transporter CrcB [Pseudomonadota bacterium]